MSSSWLRALRPHRLASGQRVGLDPRRSLDVGETCPAHQQTGVERMKRRYGGERHREWRAVLKSPATEPRRASGARVARGRAYVRGSRALSYRWNPLSIIIRDASWLISPTHLATNAPPGATWSGRCRIGWRAGKLREHVRFRSRAVSVYDALSIQ